MLEKLKSRGAVVTALALAAMVVLFIAHFQATQNESAVSLDTPRAAATTPAPAPAPRTLDTPVAAASEPEVATPEPPREVTYEEAEAAYNDRRYDDAVRLFTAYTDRRSRNPFGFYMLGLSAWKSGDPERAAAAFEQSIALDSTHVKSYINLSRVLVESGRAADALARVDDALAIDPQNGDAHRVRGRVLQEIGNDTDAAAAYREAIRLDANDAWSMNNLALILIREGRYDEALPALARAIEIRDDVAVFYNNLGMALECTGHFHDAVEAYATAVDIDARYANANANLARASTVLEEPGLEPVDLAAAARRFADEVASWSRAEVASETVRTGEIAVVPSTAGADSTARGE